jgi:hypothetical protein
MLKLMLGKEMKSYCWLLVARHRKTRTATTHWDMVMNRGASSFKLLLLSRYLLRKTMDIEMNQ